MRRFFTSPYGVALIGVRTHAHSYWSLLAPAIDLAVESGQYGAAGQYAFVPVAIGFALGAAFVYGADYALPLLVGAGAWLRSPWLAAG